MARYDDPNVYKAGLVIIGNEILSGRTQDTNAMWIAENLLKRGVVLREIRVVPDMEDSIIDAVRTLSPRLDYVFTTGGIGPTHDDITSESIAKAFGVELERNPEAYRILEEHYAPEPVNEARAKMAMIPRGAKLIPNPVSGAPGFVIDNVYVMAGIPRVMHAMLSHVLDMIKPGKPVLSNTVSCGLPESVLAGPLDKIQEKYKEVEIGSYPHFRGGSMGLSLVMRSTNPKKLRAGTKAVIKIIRQCGDRPRALSLQVPID